MRAIDISNIDNSLLSDLAGNLAGYAAFEANDDTATCSNQCYHIVFCADQSRGGIVFVGSGSNGMSAWTDADSASDVLEQFIAGEMRG